MYRGNPFTLYGENVFIGVQMLVVVGLFGAFGEGSKIVYAGVFAGVVGLAWLALADVGNLPVFLVENSIILQTLLSSFVIYHSMCIKNDSNLVSFQDKVHWIACLTNVGPFFSWKSC